MAEDTKSKDSENNGQKGERIAKVMARAGLCSRREAESWITAGRVQVNGKILQTPACIVIDQDEIIVDGKKLAGKEKTRLFMYHKPAGLVTTNKDEQGRETIFEKFPKDLPRVVTVGRLDINTEGLLLLTNDGELSRYLELPATGLKRTYRARAHGHVSQNKLDKLKNGIRMDGVNYQGIDAELEKQQGDNAWIMITLAEGKNREIRNVMEAVGLKVNRLIRISYGPFHLGNLPTKSILEVKTHMMKDQLKGFFK